MSHKNTRELFINTIITRNSISIQWGSGGPSVTVKTYISEYLPMGIDSL